MKQYTYSADGLAADGHKGCEASDPSNTLAGVTQTSLELFLSNLVANEGMPEEVGIAIAEDLDAKDDDVAQALIDWEPADDDDDVEREYATISYVLTVKQADDGTWSHRISTDVLVGDQFFSV